MTATLKPSLGLPAHAYSDEAWLARERELLFEKSWTLVGSAEALAAPGACVPVQVGRNPLLVVRQADGTLQAFHNVCRHRGMAIIAETRAAGDRLRCGYHGWQYGLDGTLDLVPQRGSQFADIDLSACGLMPAAVDTWEGIVFVHPDSNAAPLADALGPLTERIGSFRPSQLTELATCSLEGDFNWKLFVENHIDIYHLWYLHEVSLGSFDHTRFEHVTTVITHIDDRDRRGIGAHMVFPNLLMATAAEFFATYAVYPISPTRSRVDLRIRGEVGADADALLNATRSFINEDIAACEGVQLAVSSRYFGVGALAVEHERPITEFHRALLAVLGEPS
jgi:phenylpropionate dioxygenase-like ring-hydroxylating dioxygenase large terminal subunit